MRIKVRWTGPDRLLGRRLKIRGRSTSGKTFQRAVDVGSSILDIPEAGCWNLKMTVRHETVTLRVQAFDH